MGVQGKLGVRDGGRDGGWQQSCPHPAGTGGFPGTSGSELNLLRGLLLTMTLARPSLPRRRAWAPSKVTCFFPSVAALLSGQEEARGREGEVVSDFLWGCESGGSHTAWVSKEEEQSGHQARRPGLQTGRKFSWSTSRQNRILSLGTVFLPAPATRAQTGLLLFS